MQTTKPPKIIYFLADSAPTPDEAVEMLEYGSNVQVRNSRYIGENDGREECDGVAGSVPSIYREAPTAAEAIAAYKAKVRERMALVGDNQAPQAAEQHAVRLMGARTAPGPEDVKEVPAVAVIDPDANTSHPDTTAPIETKPNGPTPAATTGDNKPPKPPKPTTTPTGWKANQ